MKNHGVADRIAGLQPLACEQMLCCLLEDFTSQDEVQTRAGFTAVHIYF
ncbi:hypothetical protein [Aeromonas jandaei]|nr:hypothetical protein [Aeromonas jandaei]